MMSQLEEHAHAIETHIDTIMRETISELRKLHRSREPISLVYIFVKADRKINLRDHRGFPVELRHEELDSNFLHDIADKLTKVEFFSNKGIRVEYIPRERWFIVEISQ